MVSFGEFREWKELAPDVCGLIFRRLPLREILTVVPMVCKSWARVVSGPYCWQEINILEWSMWCKPEQLERMLQMLVARSCGSVRVLSVEGLPNDSMLSFIAEHAHYLQTLEIPRCEISDPIVECVAPKFSQITCLDVSYCKKIGASALEAFGRHCKSLVMLRRKMHPLEVADKTCQDDEAHAIARTMLKLRHLDVAYMVLTNNGVLEILSRCRDLEFLDLRGCWEVKLDDKLMNKRHSGVKLLGPDIDDYYYERDFSDECSDDLDSSLYSIGSVEGEAGWESDGGGFWDDEHELDGVEMSFYHNGFDDPFARFEWPPPPLA